MLGQHAFPIGGYLALRHTRFFTVYATNDSRTLNNINLSKVHEIRNFSSLDTRISQSLP
jgi:hypothetical protein